MKFWDAAASYAATFELTLTRRRVRIPSLDVELEIASAGEGPPLILLAGANFPAVTLAPLVRSLMGSFRLCFVDRPGCGGADPLVMRPDAFKEVARVTMRAVLDALDVQDADVVASSLGATFAIIGAAEQPQRYRRLVVAAPPAGIESFAPVPMRLLATPWVGEMLMRTVGKPSVSNLRSMFTQAMVADIHNVSDTLLQLIADAGVQPGSTESWLSTIRALVDWRGMKTDSMVLGELERLRCVTTLLCGEHDAVTPPEVGRRAFSRVPRGRTEVIAGAGHLLWLDRLEASVAEVRRALL